VAILSIEMTGAATRPDLTVSATASGFAALALALLALRCLPLRMVFAVATVIGCLIICPAPEPVALDAIASCQRAARWYPGRAACLELSLASFIALALQGYRADWCIGCRFGPVETHAWIETACGPVGEPDRPARPLHLTVRI
jgi:hypothetical protein